MIDKIVQWYLFLPFSIVLHLGTPFAQWCMVFFFLFSLSIQLNKKKDLFFHFLSHQTIYKNMSLSIFFTSSLFPFILFFKSSMPRTLLHLHLCSSQFWKFCVGAYRNGVVIYILKEMYCIFYALYIPMIWLGHILYSNLLIKVILALEKNVLHLI